MKQFYSVLLMFVFISAISLAQSNPVQDIATKSEGPITVGHLGTPQYDGPDAVLYDVSELVNNPGGGYGGADGSMIEAALGHTLYGWGHQHALGYIIADSFTVPIGETWQIDELTTFAYQTGSGTTSTITGVYAQIYDGDPMGSGTVIWGDLTTNRMTNTTWSNIYRTTDTAPLDTQRPIMVQTSTIGTTLSAGTYWIGWNTDGTLSSGPWCPPRTILGVAVTGHARQYTTGWAVALNGTSENGAPFILSGGGPVPYPFTDDFEAYIAGQQLACQATPDWTTWSLLPCDPTEDPYVSSNYAYSGANSTVIVQNNDLVHVYDPAGAITSGTWYASLLIYIPTGKSGYFNELATFTGGTYNWGLECYFNAGGAGSLNAGGTGAASFTWQEDTWQQAVVVVDVDNDVAEFWFGDSDPLTMIYSWQWTLGSNGVAIPLSIDANDIFGAAATDEMYIDNYYFGDAMPPIIPVELTSFTAVSNNGVVQLNWQTATEVNNHMFEIERKAEASEFTTIGYVEGSGTTTEPQSYSYTDNEVETGTYTYRLKQVDFDGTFTYSNEVEVDVTAPLTFNLGQNYPNPFNPSTKINYSIPEAGNVKLAVYNIVGEEVAVLVNGFTQTGSFDVTFNASNLPSGVYIYKLQSANSVQTKKMLLLK
jgi:hypothetical protein